MNTETILNNLNTIHNDLKIVNELVYKKCGFELTNLKENTENLEYAACSYELNGKIIQHRVAKITPTKTGQFVAIWKRNKNGITAPFDFFDDLDFILITARSNDNFGVFIFPKTVLAEKGIITKNGKEGKRGIRVYPPWDKTTNKQADKTQGWQTNYFLSIKNDNAINLHLAKQLFEVR